MSTKPASAEFSRSYRDGTRFFPLKRVFDCVFSGLAILALLPIMVVVAIAIRVVDGGPAFFVHKRVGMNGSVFPCLKFRTMVMDADARLKAHLASDETARQEFEATHKLRNDPRVLPKIGAFLRATSLDELPQFLNVLAGHMSVVGPRPVTETELRDYDATRALYESVRPGITGLWQVSGRSDLSFKRRVELDSHYIQNWSFVQDLAIIYRTISVVLLRRGAV